MVHSSEITFMKRCVVSLAPLMLVASPRHLSSRLIWGRDGTPFVAMGDRAIISGRTLAQVNQAAHRAWELAGIRVQSSIAAE